MMQRVVVRRQSQARVNERVGSNVASERLSSLAGIGRATSQSQSWNCPGAPQNAANGANPCLCGEQPSLGRGLLVQASTELHLPSMHAAIHREGTLLAVQNGR